MSVQWLSWVFEKSTAKGSKRLVLLSLANHADDSGVCWPGLDAVAREAGLSRRRAEDALRALVAEGVVERDINCAPVAGHAGYRTNLYRIIRQDPSEAREVLRVDRIRETRARHSGHDAIGPPEASPPDAVGPPIPSGPDGAATPDSSHSGVDDSSFEATTERPPKPSVEPSVEPSVSATGLAAQRFDAHFWPVYPRRHGRRVGKAKALTQWKKLSVAQQRDAVKGARAYAAHCGSTGSYPKDAERWLRDRLWEEWLGPDDPPTSGIGAAADLPNGGRLTVVPSTPEEWQAMGFPVGATSA